NSMSEATGGAVPLKDLGGGTKAGHPASLDTLLDMSLPVSIEFGRTSMTVQEVLALGAGSVIQLEPIVGEPIDIFVSDRQLAEGDALFTGGHFGVRIARVRVDPDGNEAAA